MRFFKQTSTNLNQLLYGIDPRGSKRGRDAYLYYRSTTQSGHHKRTWVHTFFRILQYNKFLYMPSKASGHDTYGHHTVSSKGSTHKFKRALHSINMNNMRIFLYAFWYIRDPRSYRLSGISFSTDGGIQTLPVTRRFHLMRLYLAADFKEFFTLDLRWVNSIRYIENIQKIRSFTLVSYVPNILNGRPLFARARGSACLVRYRNKLQHLGLIWVKLPSGKYRRVSNGNSVLLGKIAPKLRSELGNTRAGYWVNRGIKPQVRGIVKNPVDHPNGGRARSIARHRSPWGWFTK
uniref:Large ribosomal subunit protein uL2m n=1 Tax=Nyctotherus ovalis TaxID=70075 RepID=RL2H_NYCOV|nr:RecName: Full=Large ribosomal subunit protein uL2m; AltName: Full=60S ribosomal protein L2, hydrogenosomal [Nyctotherus ovalis]CAI38861.1 ribosomal protein L2 [Nyctotherus ovalis]